MTASVVDFTDALAPCPKCGAEGYFDIAVGGSFIVRYRCGHCPYCGGKGWEMEENCSYEDGEVCDSTCWECKGTGRLPQREPTP
jgi:DnaJ-class molecular chaperone